MSGGGAETPVAATEDTKQKQKGSSSTSGETAASTTPTLPPWLSGGLQSEFGNYLATTGNFGQGIEDWEAAGFAPDQLAGFESWRQAAGPGGIQQTALDELMKTAQGNYLYGGEGFNAAVDAAYRAGVPSTISQFAGAGRDSNFLGTAALNQIYSDAFARQYGDERGRQQQAQLGLPGLSLLPGQTLQDIGKQYQGLEQYGMNYPLEQLYPELARLQLGGVGFAAPFLGQDVTGSTDSRTKSSGLTTGTGTSTPAYFPGSPAAGILGGIASGAGTGGMIGGPWGALAGGILGGGAAAFA